MVGRWVVLVVWAGCSAPEPVEERQDLDVDTTDPYVVYRDCQGITDNDPPDRYTYSNAGDLLSRERQNGDTWEISEEYTWRDDHQPLTSWVTRNGGTTEIAYTYENDRLVREDGSWDGESESDVWMSEYLYEQGVLVSVDSYAGPSTLQLDLSAVETYQYNDDGSLKAILFDNVDYADTQAIYTWENGLLARLSSYFFDEWQAFSTNLYTYDENGWLVQTASDYNADDVPDRVQTLERDEEGRVTLRSTDRDGDGDDDTIIATTWDCPTE